MCPRCGKINSDYVGTCSCGCKGAPDLIVEILSPSTLRHDRLVKLNLYQRARVREYWIVDPENRSVMVFLPDSSGSFRKIALAALFAAGAAFFCLLTNFHRIVLNLELAIHGFAVVG